MKKTISQVPDQLDRMLEKIKPKLKEHMQFRSPRQQILYQLSLSDDASAQKDLPVVPDLVKVSSAPELDNAGSIKSKDETKPISRLDSSPRDGPESRGRSKDREDRDRDRDRDRAKKRASKDKFKTAANAVDASRAFEYASSDRGRESKPSRSPRQERGSGDKIKSSADRGNGKLLDPADINVGTSSKTPKSRDWVKTERPDVIGKSGPDERKSRR